MSSAYATFVACSAALGGSLFGFDSAVINGAGTGFAVASVLLGCADGALENM